MQIKIDERIKFRLLASATFGILAVGTVFYHFVEGWAWLDSLYFSTVTLATVGFGDFTPQTQLGKVFTIFYIFSGIGLIFSFAQTFVQRAAKKTFERREKRGK